VVTSATLTPHKAINTEKMNKNRYFISLALLLAAFMAQAASFRVQAPRQVVAGGKFRVEFVLDGSEGTNLSIPNLAGAELLYGPEVSTSMNMSIINGHQSSSFSQVFTMLYQAVTPGRHTLGAASITANGKRLSTRPVTIEILPSGSTPSSSYNQHPTPPMPQSQSPDPIPDLSDPMKQSAGDDVDARDFFVKISLSKDVVYEQEAVVCTIKLYTRYSVTQFHCTQQPSFNGFLIEELPVSNNFQLVEMINGKRYATAELKKCILYPQESGKLTITSGNFDVQLVQYDVYSTPLGQISKPVPINIKVKSNSASVNITPLPEPKPANFSGAVGDFNVTSRITPNSFKTYSPATYSIVVSGTGNLKYIQNPVVKMPKEFDTYDPQNTINTTPSGDNVSGNVRFDYMFIPQFVGDFKIPDTYFVYFNTTTQQYDSIRVDGYNLKVAKGEGKPSAHYKLRNMDIRPIDKNHADLSKTHGFFITSWGYWLIFALALLAFVAAMIAYNKIEKTRSNTSLMRTRRASKLAQRRLKNAHALMLNNDRNGFYAETLTALWGYLSDKLSIPVSELSKDNIAAEMNNFGFNEQHVNDTLSMLETCEFAQYAPELEGGNMQHVYDNCAMLIDTLEKVKRNKHNTPMNNRVVTLFFSLILALSAMASGVDYVDQGNKAYETKQYKKAIEMYERAAADGTSSQLYYNMGNAYYRLNDKANAILSYERALKLDPSNSDARYNLEFVREKAQLVGDNGANFFSSLLGDWVNHASSNTWAVIAIIALLIALAGLAFYRIAGSVALQKTGFFGAIAMGIITIAAIVCSIYVHNRSTSSNYAIITVDKASVNKSPRDGNKEVAFSLVEGVKVEITDSISQKNQDNATRWYKIETGDERTGWMKKSDLEII